jgi:hypothetical protein
VTIQTNKILIVKSDVGKFAFTRDETNNLVYQEVGKVNDFYFSTDGNEGGNLNDDWNIVDMMGLDDEYKIMVEEAIKQLK